MISTFPQGLPWGVNISKNLQQLSEQKESSPREDSIARECEGKQFPEARPCRKRSRGSFSAQMGRIKLSVMVVDTMPRIAVSLF